MVKFPLSISHLHYTDIKLLAVYLSLKQHCDSGLISKKDFRPFRYYRDKLEKLKLIKLDHTGKRFQIRRYAAAWRIFGIKKTVGEHSEIFKVWCRVTPAKTKKAIEEVLFHHKAHSHCNRIKYACNARQDKDIEVPLSAVAVAKLFGYKFPGTGSKKRKKYFKLSGPLEVVRIYNPDNHLFKFSKRYLTRKVLI